MAHTHTHTHLKDLLPWTTWKQHSNIRRGQSTLKEAREEHRELWTGMDFFIAFLLLLWQNWETCTKNKKTIRASYLCIVPQSLATRCTLNRHLYVFYGTQTKFSSLLGVLNYECTWLNITPVEFLQCRADNLMLVWILTPLNSKIIFFWFKDLLPVYRLTLYSLITLLDIT